MEKSKIDRINELAHKQKSVGLTEEEKLEQHELRQQFLDDFRAGFRQKLESIEFVDDNTPKS